MDIGERLLKLRKSAGLSQEEVANQIGVSRQTISKWETGESNPDFDKIIPICDLYGITTDELIKGEKGKVEETELNNLSDDSEYRKKTAKTLAISIFLYFFSVVWIVISESLDFFSEEIYVGIFLLIVAFATCMLVYHFVANGKSKNEVERIKRKKYTKIDRVITLGFTVLYFLVSFFTWRFDVTWIIWIVCAMVLEIAHLVLDEKERKNDE